MLFQFAMSLLNNKTEMVAFHLASVHLFFLVFISISLIEFPLTSHCCNEEDRSALLSFKSSLKDPSNRLSSWQQGSQQENCCNWHGIGCSNDSFRVVSIDLRNRVLENYYVKEIDQYISDGSNPPNTSLAGNVSLNKESNLTMIDLSSNMLAGSPVFICNLTHLTDFKLSHNNLTGGFPSCIFELKYLVTIYLSNNKLEGALPPPPLGLNTLVYINLSGNKLSGSIPYSIFPTYPQISTIVSIDLSNNSLSGMIPTNIGYCGSLQNLNLGTNNLTGNFPRGPELEKSLMYLQLSNNHLDGTIHFINTLHRLEFLNLGYNNFGGSIPTSLGSLQDIKYLSLRSNKLIGSIPEEIIHLQKLQILDLSLNNLSGCIPQKLGNWSALINNPYAYSRYLDIQIEMVTKGITIQVKELFNYSTLIDLSCNSLKGSVPKEIGLLKVLSSLNLSHNQLSDGIPEGLGNLSALESLDLSANRLIGQIPQSLTTVHSLGVLNLSYNMLSGKIPRENHFDTLSLDGFAFVGNELLCGFPIEKVCKGDGNTSTSNPTDEDDEVDREDIKDKLLLYAIVALGFAVGFWGLFSVLLMKKQKWWFPYWRFVDSSAVRIVEYIKNN
ncbi:probable leucine-rich repeat receptor-like protein kinase At1g35710 isoform X2 [Papaver somniferum]|uniref:probable leucine-rich repeat receptor-like protein kinase At1g35710 isoform X2 n=1 Tax=Papaver somniferum TaxID=3469 RepID=UPI000E700766|nr:probable leucine-rich repeat receptor-like protein kinase At1g35710 isoform X2 [Papaver somniferum]